LDTNVFLLITLACLPLFAHTPFCFSGEGLFLPRYSRDSVGKRRPYLPAPDRTRPGIASIVKDMVLVELFADGTDDASRRNQEMEDRLFQTVAIPYYAVMDSDGKVIASFPGLTKDPKEFLAFLTKLPTVNGF
jgi:hypothetical protein